MATNEGKSDSRCEPAVPHGREFDDVRLEQRLRQSEDLQKAVMASIMAEIAVIDFEGAIVAVNPAWEEFAGANDGSPEKCGVGVNYLRVCENANGRDAEGALEIAQGLRSILDGKASQYQIEYPCHSPAGERWYLLHATALRGAQEGAVVAHTDISDRVRAERISRANEQRIQAILNTAADAIITTNGRGRILSANAALERIFGYAPLAIVEKYLGVLLPAFPDHEPAARQAAFLRSLAPPQAGACHEIVARRRDGSFFPAELAVSEIEHLGIFTIVLRDITRRKELERDVVHIASMEQRRIGQDLHDSVAQELTALELQNGDLVELLRQSSSSCVMLAEQISRGLHRCKEELRAVMRGLLPVSVDAEGLMAALTDLVNQITQKRSIDSRFICPEPVSVTDNMVATQLYLIAQEAVLNSVKHSRASRIWVVLTHVDHHLRLSVEDNGVGVSGGELKSAGLGLRVMHNRAAIIGATLAIEPGNPNGTIITCTLPGRTR